MSTKPEAGGRKKTVLIVGDEAFLQNVSCTALEREAFNTISVVDGQTAVAMLPRLVADLVVLDLTLPNLGGLKVLEAIRANSRLKDLPVLALANADLPEIAAKARLAGASVINLTKSSCTPTRLLESIQELLKVSKADVANTSSSKFLGEEAHPVNKGRHQSIVPNSPDCRAKKAGFGDYVDCLVEPSQACSFALPFANGFLCRHPNSLQIASRSQGVK